MTNETNFIRRPNLTVLFDPSCPVNLLNRQMSENPGVEGRRVF